MLARRDTRRAHTARAATDDKQVVVEFILGHLAPLLVVFGIARDRAYFFGIARDRAYFGLARDRAWIALGR
jgi:hypothetical protein